MAKTNAKVVAFIRKRCKARGSSMEQALLETLDEQEKSIYLESGSTEWIDLDVSSRLIAKAAPMLFSGHEDPVYAFGLQEAKHQMDGLYKIMMKIATISLVLNQTPRIWATYYDRGMVSTRWDEEAGHAIIKVQDFSELTVVHRQKVAGFISGVFELVGVHNPICRVTCLDPQQWEWTVQLS